MKSTIAAVLGVITLAASIVWSTWFAGPADTDQPDQCETFVAQAAPVVHPDGHITVKASTPPAHCDPSKGIQ